MGKVEAPDPSEDPIRAIRRLSEEHELTEPETIALTNIIAMEVDEPSDPPLTIEDAIQDIIETRGDFPDED